MVDTTPSELRRAKAQRSSGCETRPGSWSYHPELPADAAVEVVLHERAVTGPGGEARMLWLATTLRAGTGWRRCTGGGRTSRATSAT